MRKSELKEMVRDVVKEHLNEKVTEIKKYLELAENAILELDSRSVGKAHLYELEDFIGDLSQAIKSKK